MDQNIIDRIDAYLNDEMSEGERAIFEADLENNPELKKQYDLYREVDNSMSHLFSKNTKALEETLTNLSEKYSKEAPLNSDFQTNDPKIKQIDKPNYFRLISALAAMFIMILAAYFLFFSTADSQDLAQNYFAENLTELSQTMGNSEELIQQGIAAYNLKDYNSAREYFEEVWKQDPENSEALKYLGLTYLAQKDFENAFSFFEQLTALPDLYSNPGLFYQAITLMMRNEGADVINAKELLEEVVRQNAEGSKQAKEWLDQI